MDAPFRIRPAQAADVPGVHAIERAVFSDPWSARDIMDGIDSGIPFLVAEDDGGTVVGYVVAHFGADEGEILNLGVATVQRRRGVGKALVEQMLGRLRHEGVRSVFLEVRESNAAARRLYEDLGFTPVGRRVDYYRRPTEAAVVLRTAILAEGGDA